MTKVKLARISLFITFVAVAGVFFLRPAQSQKPSWEIVWLVAHEPYEVFNDGVKVFQQTVEKETGGAVKVRVTTGSDFSPARKIDHKEALRLAHLGEVQMTQAYTSFLAAHYDKFWIFDMPFLFRDYEHASKVINGEIGRELLEGFNLSQPRFPLALAFTYSGGLRVIPSVSHAIRKARDFSGVTAAVSRSDLVSKEFYQAVGATAVPLSSEEITARLSQGTIEGSETTFARLKATWQHVKPKYINDTRHNLFVTTLMINREFFAGLPAEYQRIVLAAATKAAQAEQRSAIADNQKVSEESVAKGIEVVSLPAAEVKKLRKMVEPVYGKLQTMLGKDLIEKIRSL
jgi:TRAP-type transport system periplasmic protein